MGNAEGAGYGTCRSDSGPTRPCQ